MLLYNLILETFETHCLIFGCDFVETFPVDLKTFFNDISVRFQRLKL